MKTIHFHFDPISPFAYLAFEHLPQALEGCSYAVEYKPVLLAQHHGIAMQVPAAHPFNPLPLLRLAVACGPNRRVVEALFHHVWRGGGADPSDPQRLAALKASLAPARDPDGDEVKQALRAHTDAAIAAGIFGVPTFELDGRLFWGLDALPMLRDALTGGAWFDGPAWDEAAVQRPGITRP
jgi:2-hydroxychromene-2-carboxylate isomerase